MGGEGIPALHSVGSGIQLHERGLTLCYSGVARWERQRVGVELLSSPDIGCLALEFSPGFERVAPLRFWVVCRSMAVFLFFWHSITE